MIEEFSVKVKGFEFAGKHILVECEKTNSGEKIILKMAREDLDFLYGKIRD
jgi:hypothetical protein